MGDGFQTKHKFAVARAWFFDSLCVGMCVHARVCVCVCVYVWFTVIIVAYNNCCYKVSIPRH